MEKAVSVSYRQAIKPSKYPYPMQSKVQKAWFWSWRIKSSKTSRDRIWPNDWLVQISENPRFSANSLCFCCHWFCDEGFQTFRLLAFPDQNIDLHLLVTVTELLFCVFRFVRKGSGGVRSKVNVNDAQDECSERRALPLLLVTWPFLGLYHVYHRSDCRGYLGVPRRIPSIPKA